MRHNKKNVAKPKAPVAPETVPGEAVANETHEMVESKKKELQGLSDAIALYDRELTPEEKKTSDAIESVMQERLQTLLTAVQLAELQIKIDSMAQMLELLKPSPKK